MSTGLARQESRVVRQSSVPIREYGEHQQTWDTFGPPGDYTIKVQVLHYTTAAPAAPLHVISQAEPRNKTTRMVPSPGTQISSTEIGSQSATTVVTATAFAVALALVVGAVFFAFKGHDAIAFVVGILSLPMIALLLCVLWVTRNFPEVKPIRPVDASEASDIAGVIGTSADSADLSLATTSRL